MKITYEFSDPDDRFEMSCVRQAVPMYMALNEMADRLRSLDKHSEQDALPIAEVRRIFHEVLSDNSVDLSL
jgi:hypothetical protein